MFEIKKFALFIVLDSNLIVANMMITGGLYGH